MTRIRRFAAIGDIHAEDCRLDLVLTWLKGQAVDAILSVGDLADGGGDLDRCCQLLLAHGVLGVRGNHDRWFVQDPFRHCEVGLTALTHLAGLPPTRRLATLRGDLLLCHGVGDNDMVRLRPYHDERHARLAENALAVLLSDSTLSLAVGGHTHQRMVRSFTRQGGPPLVFINPGTLHRDDPAGFAVVDLERGVAHFHDLVEGPDGAFAVGPAETLSLDT